MTSVFYELSLALKRLRIVRAPLGTQANFGTEILSLGGDSRFVKKLRRDRWASLEQVLHACLAEDLDYMYVRSQPLRYTTSIYLCADNLSVLASRVLYAAARLQLNCSITRDHSSKGEFSRAGAWYLLQPS